MNRFLSVIIFLFLSSICWAGGSKERDTQPQTQRTVPQPAQPEHPPIPAAPVSPYFTGDGGKGMSIAILAPKASGLAENQNYLPTVVQGEFVSNFSGYSAISVLDRERLDSQYAELLSGYYDDNAKAGMDLGHLTPTDYIMGGTITRTATGYALQMQVTKTADKMTTASYSGTFTFAELDNFTGIRRASLDLLQKMGVTLTAKAREELAGAAAANQVTAQTALARGITAQRQGTEVAALSYYFQAAAYDPSLMEAASRSSILNANITSGNIGDNIRNDIQWRKDWIARLTETEQFFDNFNKTESMPYTLFYTSDIRQIGETDYRNETATMGGIETHLHGSGVWTLSIERALQAVYAGLDATGRRSAWQLASWPRQGVTNLNAFASRSKNFSVVFELVNSQNKVISRQTLQTGGSWGLSWGDRPVISVNADDRKSLNFQDVNANDITDRMTIRVATVNGTAAETAARNGVLQIRTSTKREFDTNDRFRFSRGEIQGFAGNRVADLVIPGTIWGDPVISIADRAFFDTGLTSITIGANVVMDSDSFGGNSFQGFPDCYNLNGRKAGKYGESKYKFSKGEIQGLVLTEDERHKLNQGHGFQLLRIPNTIWGVPVTSIGQKAFYNIYIIELTIPNSVTFIGTDAFSYETEYAIYSFSITLGANVSMEGDPFRYASIRNNGFLTFYRKNGMKAGTYSWKSSSFTGWKYSP